MPRQGFGPGALSFALTDHASIFDSTASTRFAWMGVPRRRWCRRATCVSPTSPIGRLPRPGRMWLSIAPRYMRWVLSFFRGPCSRRNLVHTLATVTASLTASLMASGSSPSATCRASCEPSRAPCLRSGPQHGRASPTDAARRESVFQDVGFCSRRDPDPEAPHVRIPGNIRLPGRGVSASIVRFVRFDGLLTEHGLPLATTWLPRERASMRPHELMYHDSLVFMGFCARVRSGGSRVKRFVISRSPVQPGSPAPISSVNRRR